MPPVEDVANLSTDGVAHEVWQGWFPVRNHRDSLFVIPTESPQVLAKLAGWRQHRLLNKAEAAALVVAFDLANHNIEVSLLVFRPASDMRAVQENRQCRCIFDARSDNRLFLRTVAQSTMMRVMSAFTADDLFGPRRPVVNQSLSDALQSEFDARLDAGVHVVFVGMAGVRPEAQTVAPSFENVVQSDQIRQTDIEKATANANRTLASVAGDIDRARDIVAEIERLERMRERGAQPSEESEQESRIATLILDAGGEAAQILSEAGAYRWDRHMNQRAEAARTEGRLAAYRAAPEAYRMAIYLEALKTVIKDARVFITPVVPRVEIDKKEDVPDLTGFAPMDQVEPNQ